MPVVRVGVKTFYLCGFLCCFESQPVTIHAKTPVGGYTPGQTINLEFTVKNECNETLDAFTVELRNVE